MPWQPAEVVHQHDVRKLCVSAYHGHKQGCPNHGKKEGCPPKAPLLSDICDPAYPTFVIWNRFEFGEHVARMKELHPQWSDYQLACCLYWQGTARKTLGVQLKEFELFKPVYSVTTCPEGMGVNVTETMKRLGVELEWPPVKYAYQVAVGFVRLPKKKEVIDELPPSTTEG